MAARVASEAFARTLLEASPDCLKVVGANDHVEYVNENGACLLEIGDSGDVVGRPWESLWPVSVRPKIRQSLQAARAGEVVNFRAEAPTAKGTLKRWDVSVKALPSQNDEPIKVLAVSRDVTGQTPSDVALVASEARFRAAVEAVDGIVWTNNAVGEMAGEQLGWAALTGQSLAQYQGFGWSQAVHPDDAQPTIDAWNASVAVKGLFEFEHRVRCYDGEWRWFGVRAAPTLDEKGQIVEWVGVHRDISARKAAEAHQEILMRELAHRSKNQLAVIQGVASLTARHAASLDDFQQIFAKRLQGIAISTDLLVSRDWGGAPLGDLIRHQLEPFGTEAGRLTCDGPDVFLSSDATEAIGLALHELATNCVKYGAWSAPSGSVAVCWSLSQERSEATRLHVNWTERGGPAVMPPTNVGFGRRVIEHLVAQKLGGSVELSFVAEGLSWTINAPHKQPDEAHPDGDKDDP